MGILLFFLLSILGSGILAAFHCFCRKKRCFIRHLGMVDLLFLYLFPLVRLIAPYELPFAKEIPLPEAVSGLCQVIPRGAGESHASLLPILGVIWAAVAAALLLQFAWQYQKAMAEFSSYARCEDSQCQRVFGQVLADSRKPMRICIRRSRHVHIPRGAGIFKKHILLPEEDYSDAELYYILRHEYTHFQNRDLAVKTLIHLYGCIFWWNPIIFLIKRELAQTLEIKCDLDVTNRMENRRRAEYLATIVATLKKAEAKKSVKPLYGTAALAARKCDAEILERFLIVSERPQPKAKNLAFTGAWFLAFAALILSSYSFTPTPSGYGALAEEGAAEPPPYTIECIDGTYYVSFPK